MLGDKVDKNVIDNFEKTGNLPGGNDIGGGGGSSGGAMPAPPMPVASGGNESKLTESEEKQVSKYKKMLKMRMPEQSIINKMRQDKIDEKLIKKLFPKAVGASAPIMVKKEPGTKSIYCIILRKDICENFAFVFVCDHVD